MNYSCCFGLLAVILTAFGVAASGTGNAASHSIEDTSSFSQPLQTSFKIGKSILYHTPFSNLSKPVSLGISLRIFKLLEPSATLLIGSSVDQSDGTVLNDRVLASALEIRMSPEFWNWYRPSIGIGWFYSERWPNWTGDLNEGFFYSLTLLCVATERLKVSIGRGGRSGLQPIVSAGDMRFGPIFPWGKRWTENSGNFYLEIMIFSIGVIWW